MPTLDGALLRWAVRIAAPGADVLEVRGLRDGGSPWLVRLSRGGEHRDVVVRVGSADNPSPLQTEAAALQLAARHDAPAPRLLAAELDTDPPVVLTDRLPGSSTIPVQRPAARLRALGAAAASLHTIDLEPAPGLPQRDRPIADIDWAAMRREQGASQLLMTAEQRVQDCPAPGNRVFVHGDLWQGNTLWIGDSLTGLVDWDCAGAGHPGVDLGSLRCDAAICFGPQAADDVRQGWEEAAGQAAEAVAYWDIVAALSTPPDMGWFAEAIAGQGRPDLSRQLLVHRRDAFLQAALDRLDSDA